MRGQLKFHPRTGHRGFMPRFALELLARAHAALGETDQALRACQEAIDLLAELNPDAAALADWLSTIRAS
jgi:hypothetical protein